LARFHLRAEPFLFRLEPAPLGLRLRLTSALLQSGGFVRAGLALGVQRGLSRAVFGQFLGLYG
jgi:hypothetical protein